MLRLLWASLPLIVQQLVFLVSYVSNTNSFPKPLSMKEEREYLERFRNGDMTAKNVLVERNLRLVAHVAKKYNSAVRDSEDLISIGVIGLMKAVNTFDYSKGARLATYAATCIANEILMVIRSNKKSQNDISLNEPIGIDIEGNQISLIDILSNEEDEVFNSVDLKIKSKTLHENILKELDHREKTVLLMRYGLHGEKCLTQREIAKKLDISRSYVSRIEKRALKKLKSVTV